MGFYDGAEEQFEGSDEFLVREAKKLKTRVGKNEKLQKIWFLNYTKTWCFIRGKIHMFRLDIHILTR